MKLYIEKFSRISTITSILFIILGIFLFFKPEVTLSFISYILGLVILLNGIINLISYFSNQKKRNLFDFSFILGILSVVVAIIFISKPNMIASIIPLILGIWILVNGVIKLQVSMNLRNYPNSNWVRSIVISLFNVFLGIILILNPFEGAILFTKIIGLFLVGYAVLDFLQSRTIKKSLQDGVEFIK